MKESLCASCKRTLGEGGTSFKCPICNKETIARCKSCREIGVRYNCPDEKCEFSGPN